ncbi:MobF family relaxase [Georgenia sp. MJ206]|uniref:MobF family relaxase n=1 Tax=Georgenia wangjunii TaxID=3117730 RepID=UPI002F266735
MMSMCVRYAGESYTYLLDSVTTDHGRAGGTPMSRYYAAHGTPPGTWLGAGLVGLDDGRGLVEGSFATPVQMERLFANGADPVTGMTLGQSPHVYAADADRRRPVAGFDSTFTVPKSVSVLWALADAGTADVIYECHRQAIADVVALIERDVARTRIGTNGVAQVEVNGVVSAAFDHWDSRENDPNLHTHVVIANRVQAADGRWRTLDSRAIHRAAVAMSERYDTLLADHLTRRLGLTWEYRERGLQRNPAFELTAVPQPFLDCLSQRSVAIDAEADRLIERYQSDHGRRPDAAMVLRLRQQATLSTRGAKEVRSLEELTAQWRERADTVLGAESLAWTGRVLDGGRTPLPDLLVPSVWADEAATAVLAVLARKRSTWTAWNIEAEAARALKAHRFDTVDERDKAVAAVVAEVQRRSVRLTPPEAAPTPAVLQRRDGTSAFRAFRSEVYTAQTTLDAEARLLTAGRDRNAPVLDIDHLDETGLFGDQASAVRSVGFSGRVLDVLVGPAGSGKTHTLAALRASWEGTHGRGSVLGLAPSAAAAEVLGVSLGVDTENTAKWLVEHDAEPERLRRLARARSILPATVNRGSAREVAAHIQRLTHEIERWQFRAGQLVIIDEASLAGTADLDRIVACAGEAGAKVLLVGDWAQLSAIDAGGAFGLLVRDRGAGAPELGTARRFRHAWEREAATLLRVGDADCLHLYDYHGRIREGDHDDMVDGAYATWRADELAGKRSLLIAGDSDTVRALNERARAELVVAGRVALDGSGLRDGLLAGVGDRVVTRRNDRRLTVGPRWVKNGDTWVVTARHDDGALTVKRPGGGPTVTLPARYVREYVELGYATTAFRAQGATVDTAHAIVTGPGLTREVLYVMLTRAREANTAYVCTDRPVEPLQGFSEAPTTARVVLRSVMGNVGAALSAHETSGRELDEATSIRTLAAEYDTIAQLAQAHRWTGLLTRAGLAPEQVDAVTSSGAFGALGAALRRAEARGIALEEDLPFIVKRADTGAEDLAAVLHERVDRWTEASPLATNGGPSADRLILGFLPVATTDDAAMAAALTERARLMELRAELLVHRARAAGAPWLTHLEEELGTATDTGVRSSAARMVAAYRERHQVSDPLRSLGQIDSTAVQQRRESRMVNFALARLREPHWSDAERSTQSGVATMMDQLGAGSIGR